MPPGAGAIQRFGGKNPRNGSKAAKSQLGGLSARCYLHWDDTHLDRGHALPAVTSLTEMALYVVSYDLSKPEQHYPQLLEYLHLLGARRLLDSQWMVRSGATSDAVYQGIRAHIDSNDALLVCLVGSAVGTNLKHPLGEI